MLRVEDNEALFNPNAKSSRGQIGLADKQIVLRRQDGRCNICGSYVREASDIRPHTFAKDRVSMEFDHRIPVDRGGESDLDNYQALCHYCNKCKRQMCFVCHVQCNAQCALVTPEEYSVVLATGEDISDRIR